MCKSIFVNLGGGGGGSVNTGVLQIAGGVALDSTLRFVEDQNGTDSALQLSTTNVAMTFADTSGLFYGPYSTGGVYSGIWDNKIAVKNTTNFSLLSGNGETYLNANSGLYLSINGPSTPLINLTTSGFAIGQSTTAATARLQVRGDGTNDIARFLEGGGLLAAYINNRGEVGTKSEFADDGGFVGWNGNFAVKVFAFKRNSVGGLAIQSYQNIGFSVNGAYSTSSYAMELTSTGLLAFGGTTSSFPSIKRSGINIEVRLADDTGYGGITAGRSTEKTLEVLEVSGAMGLGFFNTPAINQPTVAIGEANYVSSGGGGSQIRTDDTIGGYTMQQVVQALQNLGLLA
jgi:hypothetical protein